MLLRLEIVGMDPSKVFLCQMDDPVLYRQRDPRLAITLVLAFELSSLIPFARKELVLDWGLA